MAPLERLKDVQTLRQELSYAVRSFRKNPAFTLLAVVTLALGMGATTTIVSVLENILFDPFPGHTVDRAVNLQIRDAAQGSGGVRLNFQVPEFLDYQEQVRSFEEVIGGTFEDVLYSAGEGSEQFSGGLVTVNNFSFLGVPAALGRTLLAEDARPEAPPVFVLNHKTWMTHFGGDPGAIGRSFVLNGVPTTLVGVMPPTFAKLGADLYMPVVLDRADRAIADRFFMLQARLKPGVTLAQAEAEVAIVAARLAKEYPELYPERFTVKVVNLLDSVIGQFRATLYTLAAAVGLLLLIACSNVANLLLARATTREREMALRAALGASRSRLVRQMLVESALLAAAGAIFGCLLAFVGVKAVVASIPVGLIPRQTVIGLNLPVLAVTFLVAAATSMVCGLVPALRAARKDIVEPLKDSGKGTGGGARRHRLANALVVAEVALSLVLLVGAGLLIRSFAKLQSVDLGLDATNVLQVRIPLRPGQYKTAADKQRFFGEAMGRIQALPGVVSVATTSGFPVFGGIRTDFDAPGRVHTERWQGIVQLVSENYASTLKLRLRKGRFLTADDVDGARRMAVVNEALVRRCFGDEDPLGRTIEAARLAGTPEGSAASPGFEIVGVLADATNSGLQDPILPEVFVPYTVTGVFDRRILVKTTGSPMALLESVKREVWAVDRGAALTFPGSLTDALREVAYGEPRLVLSIVVAFAAVGLVLVGLGIFSVVAYTVSRQTHEIGIRMALGASRADVLEMVLRYGLKMVGLGAAAGLVGSLALRRVLVSRLYGVAPHDPATLAAVMGVVALAGFAACYVPARRATRVAPMVALRSE